MHTHVRRQKNMAEERAFRAVLVKEPSDLL